MKKNNVIVLQMHGVVRYRALESIPDQATAHRRPMVIALGISETLLLATSRLDSFTLAFPSNPVD